MSAIEMITKTIVQKVLEILVQALMEFIEAMIESVVTAIKIRLNSQNKKTKIYAAS